jgi:hypothetical protein
MALEIPHTSISQLTNSSLLLSSRNKINRTKTAASTCFLDCLTLMMKALCYFKTKVSLYHRHSQHPKIPETSAYVRLLCVLIFSPVMFIFAYFVRLCFTHSHKMTEFLFLIHSVHTTGEPHLSLSSEGWPHTAWMWHPQYLQWWGLIISLSKKRDKVSFYSWSGSYLKKMVWEGSSVLWFPSVAFNKHMYIYSHQSHTQPVFINFIHGYTFQL